MMPESGVPRIFLRTLKEFFSFKKENIVNLQSFCKKAGISLSLFGLLISAVVSASAQQPTLVVSRRESPTALAGRTNLYCAGYVQTGSVNTANRIIGAETEDDGFNYAENDFVYINMGSSAGVREGDMFAVIRPRGKVSTRWSNKGSLGFYVQELGALQVVSVRPDHSVARITTSCDAFLLGDLVQPVEQRVSPVVEESQAFDRFRSLSGRANGRIFMARDMHEMIGRDQVVYVDLGREDNVSVGDKLTVYRTVGTGNLDIYQPESVEARVPEYKSDEYRGGEFSNQAARKSGSHAGGSVVTTEEAKDGRPRLRKIVGEAVIVNVKERTATAVITRTVQEIHTGDWVELR